MNTSAMSLNLTPNKKFEAFASKMLERTDKLAQKTIGFLKNATVATAMTASTLAAEGGIIWSIDHFFDNGRLTKEIILAFNKNKTPNNPTNNTTISNDTLQYDNFPDNNPNNNTTIGSDTFQHTNSGTENITFYEAVDTVLLSTLQKIVDKYNNVEYEDIQMLLGRFQGLIKENKPIDYKNFTKQVNKVVNNIQNNPDENYRRNAGKIVNTIIASLNATLTADGRLLTNTVRYNDCVANTSSGNNPTKPTKPNKPTKPDPLAGFDYKAYGVTTEQWNKLTPKQQKIYAESMGFDISKLGDDDVNKALDKTITAYNDTIADLKKQIK